MQNIITKNGGIFFSNIREGFDKHCYKALRLDEKTAISFFNQLLLENGEKNSFCDFYYKELDALAQKKVEESLTTEEIAYIKKLEPMEKVFYKLEPKLIEIISKLNFNEILFSTLYFTKNPATFWGNYNQEYIVFTLKGE